MLEREALVADSGKYLSEITASLQKASQQINTRGELLQKQYRAEHGPALRQIAKLEGVVKAKQESEKLLRKISDIARQRAKGVQGYRDDGAEWRRLPAAVQGIVQSYQQAAPDQRIELAKDERIKDVARWLEAQDRDRGMSR